MQQTTDFYNEVLSHAKSCGMNLRQFAAHIGVSRQTIENWKQSTPKLIEVYRRIKEQTTEQDKAVLLGIIEHFEQSEHPIRHSAIQVLKKLV